MDTIVDWDRDTPQWSAVLAAADSCNVGADLPGNRLWPLYAALARISQDQDVVIGQIGQSLDGRIATATGHSHYINGKAALVHLHRLRALVDAVIVGIGTVTIDDPQLTVRHARARVGKAPPARVILDPNGRLSPQAKCLQADGARRIVVRREGAKPGAVAGVEYISLPAGIDALPPRAILAALQKMGLRRVLVEGGANTLSRFLAADCLDRLHIMTAPLLIGSGPSGIQLTTIDRLDQAIRPVVTAFALPGGDIISDCDLRTPRP